MLPGTVIASLVFMTIRNQSNWAFHASQHFASKLRVAGSENTTGVARIHVSTNRSSIE
jgi:hypothetical protein